MSRKRLKNMLRKEMDERIKSYEPKQVEKPSLKFDLKTDLLGKKQEEEPIKEVLKEEPVKEEVKEEPVKPSILKKYLEEDDDYSSSSSSEDYSESDYSEEEESVDFYKEYKNKVNKIDEKMNFRKLEKSEENKVKRDVDRKKEDERKDDRKNDDFRKIENERKTDRKFLDDYKRRDDRDDYKRRDDRDEPRRRDDRDEPRRRDDRDEPRRRDDRDEPRRRDDRDEPRRRDDRDEPRRRDEVPSREVNKGNQFVDLPKRYILQTIKNRDVDTISADCVDEIKDILQNFTSHMFELFSEGDKVVIAERDDVKAYIGLFIEDEDKEMVNDIILPSKDIELAINNISDIYNVKIKKDVIYLVHMFLESILAKVIDGAKLINEMCKTKRLSGKEIKTAYKIYML
jgi:hypothetical protein